MYSEYPNSKDISDNFAELEILYTKSFKEFLKILPKSGRVVICLPAYRNNKAEYEELPNLDFVTKLGYNLVSSIVPNLASKFPFLKQTSRGSIIYDRKDQIVAREIVIFEKI